MYNFFFLSAVEHIYLLFISWELHCIFYCLGTQTTSLQRSYWLITGASLQRRCITRTWRVGPVLWNSLSDCDSWSTCVLHTLDPFELERLWKHAWPWLGFNQCRAIWLLWCIQFKWEYSRRISWNIQLVTAKPQLCGLPQYQKSVDTTCN